MFTLRQATDEDYEFLYKLHEAAMREYIAATWEWQDSWQREYFQRNWDPSARRIIQISEVDAGVVVVDWQPDACYIGLIELLPAYQRQGIGTAVLCDICRQARERQLSVSLHVLKTNQPARDLYERLGFQVVAEEEVRYKLTWMP